MWICLNNAFLSVVADRDRPEQVLVRARKEKHLKSFLALSADTKKREIITTPQADYIVRAYITRAELANLLALSVQRINYPKFKPSVKEKELHDLYMRFWSSHYSYQEVHLDRGGGIYG
jgi:hypothetical protein